MAKKFKKPAPISSLRTYHFTTKNKDPVIEGVRSIMDMEGYSVAEIHTRCGIAKTTLYNWLDGPTRRPQWATLVGVFRSMGYDAALIPLSGAENQKVDGKGYFDAVPPRIMNKPVGRPPAIAPLKTHAKGADPALGQADH